MLVPHESFLDPNDLLYDQTSLAQLGKMSYTEGFSVVVAFLVGAACDASAAAKGKKGPARRWPFFFLCNLLSLK